METTLKILQFLNSLALKALIFAAGVAGALTLASMITSREAVRQFLAGIL